MILEKIFNFFLPVLYFTPILRHNYICRKFLLIPLYKNKQRSKGENCNRRKNIIYMVQPETTFSGGLSDRFRGITSIYAECKHKNLPFRIVFEPFCLQDYLVPNKYDWRIEAKDICWDVQKVYPCTLLTYHHNLHNCLQRLAQRIILSYY